ncbi:MAG TPA: cell division protein FtsB [Castellaniella sp.]|uniref:cell division protein FtsB n=1 Tax=Castellaniella sp. TaxID=1955812 RepID=UPI002F13E15D
MRLLCLALLALTLATQYPLWWGKGGWLSVRGLQSEVKAETDNNQALTARNNALAAEVQDLKTGTSAVEERARSELNMIREGEYFVQILPPEPAAPAAAAPRTGPPPLGH